jgi:hypothetical protein
MQKLKVKNVRDYHEWEGELMHGICLSKGKLPREGDRKWFSV